MSLKYKLIKANALIVVLFASVLTYAASYIVNVTSGGQFEKIKESIVVYNEKLLLSFLQANSLSLTKEAEWITEHIRYLSDNFHKLPITDTGGDLKESLMTINKDLKPFIESVSFVNIKNREEIKLIDGRFIQSEHSATTRGLTRFRDMLVEKRISDNHVSNYYLYTFPSNYPGALLKFELNLEYFSGSLTSNSVQDYFQPRYFLLDSQGKLLTSNLKQDPIRLLSVMQLSAGGDSVYSHVMNNIEGSLIVDNGKELYNVMFRQNKLTRWRIILVTPESVVRSTYETTKKALMSADDTLLKAFSFTTLALLLMFLGINTIVIKCLTLPIGRLIEQASALKEGDFQRATLIVEGAGAEMRQLSYAYAEAGKQIKTLISGLETEVELRSHQYELAATEAKLAANEAKDANKQKSILLSNVSHEIRTPLMPYLAIQIC
ncbi:hypothetical protein AB8613_15050 [Vibrio sp. BS-M-Sm-2]|uniref:hypothetical protein n=1 Tax=Vibrio sp. BS-M-Sm-2 TaxID=3241167 RepID=UPI00355899F9